MESKNALGAATLSGGSASFATSTRPAGTHPIKAVYGGDASFIGSTSKVVNQVVSKATTTTTLASSRNLSNFGQSVTFTASVTPQFSGRVKGIVTFYDAMRDGPENDGSKRRRGKVHNLDTDREARTALGRHTTGTPTLTAVRLP